MYTRNPNQERSYRNVVDLDPTPVLSHHSRCVSSGPSSRSAPRVSGGPIAAPPSVPLRHLFISRDTIMFSVDSQIQMVAESRRKGDGTEDDRLTNATSKYQQMFFSWFNKHIGKAKSKMLSFVLEKKKAANMNNIKDNEEIDIELVMPHWWDDTAFDQLTAAVDDYLVNAILQEFFTVTLTSKDPVTIDKATLAADALSDIRKYANAARPATIRKHLAPF